MGNISGKGRKKSGLKLWTHLRCHGTFNKDTVGISTIGIVLNSGKLHYTGPRRSQLASALEFRLAEFVLTS